MANIYMDSAVQYLNWDKMVVMLFEITMKT